jgi:hypothetical protein
MFLPRSVASIALYLAREISQPPKSACCRTQATTEMCMPPNPELPLLQLTASDAAIAEETEDATEV